MSDSLPSGNDRELSARVPDIALEPLSRHRIMDALQSAGIAFSVDRDGDVSGDWDHCRIYFRQVGKDGDLLSVRGVWWGRLPQERRADLLEACNTWNSRRFFPTAEVYAADDGTQHVFGDHTVPYEYGLTDEQLHLHIASAVDCINTLSENLVEKFPDGVDG